MTVSGTVRTLVAASTVVALAGCGAGDPQTSPSEPPASSPAAAEQPPADPGERVCADSPAISQAVDRVAGAAEAGPVLPAGVALFLVAPRDRAAVAVDDPELSAALEEFVAAVDDIDAQAREALPEGGSAVEDAVEIDTDRLVSASDGIEQACDQR